MFKKRKTVEIDLTSFLDKTNKDINLKIKNIEPDVEKVHALMAALTVITTTLTVNTGITVSDILNAVATDTMDTLTRLGEDANEQE